MALDIIETKLSTLIYRRNLNFQRGPLTLSIFLNFSKEVCNNFPSNFEISGISILVYNLNPSIRSTLLNYKQFVIQLNIDKDPNSIKCCCNK